MVLVVGNNGSNFRSLSQLSCSRWRSYLRESSSASSVTSFNSYDHRRASQDLSGNAQATGRPSIEDRLLGPISVMLQGLIHDPATISIADQVSSVFCYIHCHHIPHSAQLNTNAPQPLLEYRLAASVDTTSLASLLATSSVSPTPCPLQRLTWCQMRFACTHSC